MLGSLLNIKMFHNPIQGIRISSQYNLLKNGYRQNYPSGLWLRCGKGHCCKTSLQ